MPAINMGSSTSPPANPSTGKFVMMSPFSGPKGSPFDAKSYDPTTRLLVADPNNRSTGALSTGIGFGANHVFNPVAPFSIIAAGFYDSYTPGASSASGISTTDARFTCIGGGRNVITGGGATGLGISVPSPYAVQPLLGFGNGASRDAGAGPAFTGFATKTVTATAPTAVGAAIEAGFINRSDQTIATGYSAFGSSTAASAAVT